MLQLPDMNEVRDAASHHSIAFIGVIALPAVMCQHDPIGMLAYYGDEFGVFCSGQEVRSVAFYAIARELKRVGHDVAEIAVGEEGKLMLRIRKLVLPLAQPVRARNPP